MWNHHHHVHTYPLECVLNYKSWQYFPLKLSIIYIRLIYIKSPKWTLDAIYTVHTNNYMICGRERESVQRTDVYTKKITLEFIFFETNCKHESSVMNPKLITRTAYTSSQTFVIRIRGYPSIKATFLQFGIQSQ